jgi:hypothetical protein
MQEEKQNPAVIHKFAEAREKAEATNKKPYMSMQFMEDVAMAASRVMGDSYQENFAVLVYTQSVDALLYAKTVRRLTGMSLQRAVAVVSAALPEAGVVMGCQTFVSTIATIAAEIDAGAAQELADDMRKWRIAYYRRRYGRLRWLRPTWWRALL